MNKGDVKSTLSLSTDHSLSDHTETDLKLGFHTNQIGPVLL